MNNLLQWFSATIPSLLELVHPPTIHQKHQRNGSLRPLLHTISGLTMIDTRREDGNVKGILTPDAHELSNLCFRFGFLPLPLPPPRHAVRTEHHISRNQQFGLTAEFFITESHAYDSRFISAPLMRISSAERTLDSPGCVLNVSWTEV